ncbi:MAG TPA: IS1182 family transposase [Acidimicrobiales bacterium]|nr:IS1182 family transposase [Acidimicrobiales bacterium]
MSLGLTPRQTDLFATTTGFCESRVPADSIYGLLHRQCFELFPDELFADLFTDVGRRSVPPMIVAVVMVLQRLEGCSDREAVDRFAYDLRWKYAAGGLDFDYPGFVHTVLVDMRARLAASERPDRVFEVTLAAAREAGMVGRRRVLDSTALFDAVATMDTVTLIRSAIRGVLAACASSVEQELRSVLVRADDYRGAGKPVCDWDDRQAREELVEALVRDARAVLAALEGRELEPALAKAAELLATVAGQDVESGEDGRFRIARKVAKDRVISTVDPDARHGHKTAAHGFDGYKGHVSIDPDSEVILATAVTAGNAADGAAVAALLGADLPAEAAETAETETPEEPLTVYGDSAYGTGALLDSFEEAGVQTRCKTQPPRAPGGRFPKSRFGIDLDAGTVTCPASHTVTLRTIKHGQLARFGVLCAGCPLAARCTSSRSGRTIHLGQHERQLAAARNQQTDPAWRSDYTQTRPKIERKISHLMRRKHGGRRARVRGTTKVAADFQLLAAAVNLARFAVLGLNREPTGWALSTS